VVEKLKKKDDMLKSGGGFSEWKKIELQRKKVYQDKIAF